MRVVPQLTNNKQTIARITVGFITIVAIIATISFRHTAEAVPTSLSPNDVVIVTANSDSGWSSTACSDGAPGGPNSNAIDLLLRKDIGSGTVIKVTDNAWTGSAFTSSEGIITYTAPTDLPAGTIIRYSDCLYNQGGSGWTRSTPIASFDTAVSGDTLLVYQGTEAAPSFIYGFGFRSNSWITSGTPTTNNSRIPAALSSASPMAYMSLGTTNSSRNYRYTAAGNYGIYSSTFLSSLKLASNWNATGGASAGTPFGPTAVPFDATRPTFSNVVRQLPTDVVTSASSVTFRVTTSEAVQPLSSSNFTLSTSGTIAYGGVSVSAVSGFQYDVTVTGLSGEGTVALASYTANLLDLQGNPATNVSFTSPSYTRDITDPVVTVNALTTNQSQPALSGTVSDAGSEVVVTVNGVNYTAIVSGTTWTLPAGTISPALTDGTYDVEVMAADLAGNIGIDATTNELVIDTVHPTVTINRAASQPDLTNVDSFIFDVVFSEAFVAGDFTAADIVLSGTTATVTSVVNIAPTQWQVTVSGAAHGDVVTASILAGAVNDTAGNASLASTSTDNVVRYDILAPVVTIDTLSTTNVSPTLAGTVDDSAAVVEVIVAGVTYTAVNDGAGHWILTAGSIVPALGVGVYDIIVRATDAAGNQGVDVTSGELTITAVITPPIHPEVPTDTNTSGGGLIAPNAGVGASMAGYILFGGIVAVSLLAICIVMRPVSRMRQ